jgi:hypothetical protein
VQAGGRDGHGLTPPEAVAAQEAAEPSRAGDRPEHERWLRAECDRWTNPGRWHKGWTEAGGVCDDNRTWLAGRYLRRRRPKAQRAGRRHTRRPPRWRGRDPNPGR